MTPQFATALTKEDEMKNGSKRSALVGEYSFYAGPNKKVTIECALEYAYWLTDTERAFGGVFWAPPYKIYM